MKIKSPSIIGSNMKLITLPRGEYLVDGKHLDVEQRQEFCVTSDVRILQKVVSREVVFNRRERCFKDPEEEGTDDMIVHMHKGLVKGTFQVVKQGSNYSWEFTDG